MKYNQDYIKYVYMYFFFLLAFVAKDCFLGLFFLET